MKKTLQVTFKRREMCWLKAVLRDNHGSKPKQRANIVMESGSAEINTKALGCLESLAAKA